MAKEEDRLSVAVILDQASYLFPAGEPGRASLQTSSQVVTMLNWAMSPHVKRLNMAFVLIDERLSDVSDRLTGNPHVASIEVPLPAEEERRLFVQSSGGDALAAVSDYSAAELGKLTAGISLTDLNVLIQSARETGRRLDTTVFRALKKRLLERQCRGLLEFIEPKWTLDTVVGHDAAKARLREDAALLKRGALDTLPMGYLLCGPVGTGKSFLAQCVSGEIGVPCLMLKNFRSKYVGETEGNLERVLAVLRAMGPVVVVIDEADAALGSRESGGRLRHLEPGVRDDRGADGGHAVSRPDHLDAADRASRPAADRPEASGPGRGPHPAVLPDRRSRDPPHVRDHGEEARHDAECSRTCPSIPQKGHLSGADIEGMVGRAWRISLLAGKDRITKEALEEVVAQFMPSTQGLERELQETAAMLECTDRQFLPEAIVAKMEAEGGRGKLQARLTAIKQLVEAM